MFLFDNLPIKLTWLLLKVFCRSKGLIVASVVLQFVSIILMFFGDFVVDIIALAHGPCRFDTCNYQLIEGSYATMTVMSVVAIGMCLAFAIFILVRLYKIKPLNFGYQAAFPSYAANNQQVFYQGYPPAHL